MRFDTTTKTLTVLLASALVAASTVVIFGKTAEGADQTSNKVQNSVNSVVTNKTQGLYLAPLLLVESSKDSVQPASRKKKSESFSCKNDLAQTLYKAGFRGHNIREAWAIAMRESNGQERRISNGVDHGLFQFNKPAWGGEPWWNTSALLTADYNAKIAYEMSDGGNNWSPWGMRDHAEWNFASYGRWSDWQIQNWIIAPYMKYYNEYPC